MAVFYDTIKRRHNRLLRTIAEIEKKLERLPEGGIYVRYQKDKVYFYRHMTGYKSEYISSDNIDLIKQLIQKDYLKKALNAAKNEASVIENLLNVYPEYRVEDVYDHLPEIKKKYAIPVFTGADRYAENWLAQPYVKKAFKTTDPVFLTLKGERVRSKSEVIIADRLFANGIPYKYECPLKIGKKVIHPDFTMLRLSDLKIIYHEHCGKMDDLDYVEERVVKRINDYSRAGIILGKNLFLTFESSTTPLNTEVLDRLINNNFK